MTEPISKTYKIKLPDGTIQECTEEYLKNLYNSLDREFGNKNSSMPYDWPKIGKDWMLGGVAEADLTHKHPVFRCR